MVVTACTGEARERLVHGGQVLDDASHLYLRLFARDVQFAVEFYLLGNLGIQVVQSANADDVKHLLYVIGGMWKIFIHNYLQIAS